MIPNTIKITNMSAAAVEITCDSFTDGTTCTIPAYGSVTKKVSTGTTSIYVEEQGMYYQKGFEVIELNASGTVELTPDAAWICLVNNSGATITSAKINSEYFSCDENGETLSSKVVADGDEIWVLVSNPFSKQVLYYDIGGETYHSAVPYNSPEEGKAMILRVDSTTKVTKLTS